MSGAKPEPMPLPDPPRPVEHIREPRHDGGHERGKIVVPPVHNPVPPERKK